MMQNRGSFRTGGKNDKELSGTKVHYNPNINAQYIRDMLASQKGVKESREVSDIEDNRMTNTFWNEHYNEKR
jgi:hypothetical protein